jgi:hypothetical protein
MSTLTRDKARKREREGGKERKGRELGGNKEGERIGKETEEGRKYADLKLRNKSFCLLLPKKQRRYCTREKKPPGGRERLCNTQNRHTCHIVSGYPNQGEREKGRRKKEKREREGGRIKKEGERKSERGREREKGEKQEKRRRKEGTKGTRGREGEERGGREGDTGRKRERKRLREPEKER